MISKSLASPPAHSASHMFSRFFGGAERRRFPRHEAALPIEFEIEVYGFEGDSRPFFASGKTVNISRSGVLARLDVPAPKGSVCKLFFRHAGDQVRPQHVAGRVVRLQEESNEFLVAVEFDAPLATLDVAAPVSTTTTA